MLELNRLFFALWPDPSVRAACHEAARELRVKMQPAGYLSAAERYHLTLLFLGDTVPPEQEAAALQAAGRLRAPPFTLRLDSASSFRNKQVPWWLGPREAPPELGLLHERLHETMTAARVIPERMRFVPHLTILRDARAPLPTTAIRPIEWRVEEFVLVRSRLDETPMRYDIIGRWKLDGETGPALRAAQLDLW